MRSGFRQVLAEEGYLTEREAETRTDMFLAVFDMRSAIGRQTVHFQSGGIQNLADVRCSLRIHRTGFSHSREGSAPAHFESRLGEVVFAEFWTPLTAAFPCQRASPEWWWRPVPEPPPASPSTPRSSRKLPESRCEEIVREVL